MNPKRVPPDPFIDNLEYIGNPYKQSTFSARPFLNGIHVSGADVDLEYALKFLHSYNGNLIRIEGKSNDCCSGLGVLKTNR